MNGHKLLIDDNPLQLLPKLATVIGLNEAVVLQQVHYWLRIAEKAKDKRKFFDDCWWTFGTYKDWQADNFPFWSVATVGRVFRNLENAGLLISTKPDAQSWEHMKWYTINYNQLDTIECSNLQQSDVADCDDRMSQNGTILNRNSETSPETSPEMVASGISPSGDICEACGEETEHLIQASYKGSYFKVCSTCDIRGTLPPHMRSSKKEHAARIDAAILSGAQREMNIEMECQLHLKFTPNWKTKTNAALMSVLKERAACGQSIKAFSDWYWSTHWKGKKGQPPMSSDIQDNWYAAFSDEKDTQNGEMVKIVLPNGQIVETSR